MSASKLHLPKLSTQPESIFRYLCTEFAHISAQEWLQRFEDGLVYDAEGKRLNLDTPTIARIRIFFIIVF